MATGLPSYKVILQGEYGVGKSCIFRRFMLNSFRATSGKNSTIGLDQCTRIIKISPGQNVKLTLWDTGGVERMSFLGSSYYRGAHAALLVYNTSNKETFSMLSQYILDIVLNAEGAKIFLCGNMSDIQTPDIGTCCVTDADLEMFMTQCENVFSGTYRVSCKEGTGVDEMFQDIASVLHVESVSRFSARRNLIRLGDVSEKDGDDSEKQGCC